MCICGQLSGRLYRQWAPLGGCIGMVGLWYFPPLGYDYIVFISVDRARISLCIKFPVWKLIKLTLEKDNLLLTGLEKGLSKLRFTAKHTLQVSCWNNTILQHKHTCSWYCCCPSLDYMALLFVRKNSSLCYWGLWIHLNTEFSYSIVEVGAAGLHSATWLALYRK